MLLAEERRDKLVIQSTELYDRLHLQAEEIYQLKAQVRELTYNPSALESMVRQIQIPVPQ